MKHTTSSRKDDHAPSLLRGLREYYRGAALRTPDPECMDGRQEVTYALSGCIAALLFSFPLLLLIILCLSSCSSPGKLRRIQEQGLSAQIGLVEKDSGEERRPDPSSFNLPRPDTLIVHDDDGREMIIMRAVRDEDGDMVATDVLNAAVVEARFRNVAERHGLVDIEFRIRVPGQMQDENWQLRFTPTLHILGDTLSLEGVVITGAAYRRTQLRGYQQYEKYLSGIVSDTTRFINRRLLELFIQRNIPALYAFRSDTTLIDEEAFRAVLDERISTRYASRYGVSGKEAIEHYTNSISKRHNSRRASRREMMYHRYVKVPIRTEGLRLDTVLTASGEDFIYNYTHTIRTRPLLRKVDIVLSGDIYEQDRHLYSIPPTEPLTYYISSLSAFVDNTPRYRKEVVSRRVEANTACYIDFAKGSDEVDPTLGHNGSEISRIKDNLASLLENREFDLDSIIVTASCSPEGPLRLNRALSRRRSASVSSFFGRFIREREDSLRAEGPQGVITLGEDGNEVVGEAGEDRTDEIRFVSHSNPENWRMLDVLVDGDTLLSPADKARYRQICLDEPSDLDRREELLSGEERYRYYREVLYPRLRTVKFDFFLHRKGMVQDTLTTTSLDELYMEGVQAIRDRDYAKAIDILRPYGDYNTAVAYCAMDYNASALSILEPLPRTEEVNYMLALIYSRQGRDREAVEHYLRSCRQNPSFIHRGNLDPEISSLIKRYSLNRREEEDLDLGF